MSVEIDPQELDFRRPFTVEVARVLRLENTGHDPVAFKVKTTAPKQYCVRPNSGRIEPGHAVEVSVLLQAMKEDPPLNHKCRDKFLVQSVAILDDKSDTTVQQIWDSAEKTSIQERKIRVTFSAEGGSDVAGYGTTPVKPVVADNGVESTPTASTAYRSPDTDSTSAKGAVTAAAASVVGAASVAASKISNKLTPSDSKQADTTPAAATSSIKQDREISSPTTTTTSHSAPPAYEDKPVESLRAQVSGTKPQLSQDGGLRQRRAAAEDVPSVAQVATAMKPQGTEGVPVQIVAALCLLSFLLAYFFF